MASERVDEGEGEEEKLSPSATPLLSSVHNFMNGWT